TFINQWVPVTLNGQVWEEKVEVEFRTTKLPDTIPSDLIPKTVPFVNQEFFMQDEISVLSPGRIMTLDDLEDAYFFTEQDGVDYEYYAVFKQASDHDEIARKPLNYANYQGLFDLP